MSCCSRHRRAGGVDARVLADLASVRCRARLAGRAIRSRLDLLINKLVDGPRRGSSPHDGFRVQLRKPLGHFALTTALVPALRAGRSRVVTVKLRPPSSFVRPPFDDPDGRKHFTTLGGYARASANVGISPSNCRSGCRRRQPGDLPGAHPGLARPTCSPASVAATASKLEGLPTPADGSLFQERRWRPAPAPCATASGGQGRRHFAPTNWGNAGCRGPAGCTKGP